MAVNFGLLGAQASPVGNLDVKSAASLASPTTSTTEPKPEVTIIYQDIPVPAGSSGGSSGVSAGSATGAAPSYASPTASPAPAVTPGTAPAATTYSDDDHGDDHGDDGHDAPEQPDDDD